MSGLSEDDERALFEQLQNDQTQAGLNSIATTTADFRDKLIERGFTEKQAFKLAREMLMCLMDSIGFGGEPEE